MLKSFWMIMKIRKRLTRIYVKVNTLLANEQSQGNFILHCFMVFFGSVLLISSETSCSSSSDVQNDINIEL